MLQWIFGAPKKIENIRHKLLTQFSFIAHTKITKTTTAEDKKLAKETRD